jgi:hypothetical protein
MKAKSSVRLGGYAAISSMIIDIRRTRPTLTLLFCLFSWGAHRLIWDIRVLQTGGACASRIHHLRPTRF